MSHPAAGVRAVYPFGGSPAGDVDGVQRGTVWRAGGSPYGIQQGQHRLHPDQRDGDKGVKKSFRNCRFTFR